MVEYVEAFKRLAKLGVDVQVMGFSDKSMETRCARAHARRDLTAHLSNRRNDLHASSSKAD